MIDIKPTKKFAEQQIASCNELLTQQISVAWEETRDIKLPASYQSVQNIVFAGMGGSALGAHILTSVFAKELKVPFEIVRSYTLPAYVGRKTLVILSSFSGSTEEVLAIAKEAKEKKALILVITSGGQLVQFMKKEKIPGYVFDPMDLASQPRMGLGFSVVGVLGLLERAKLLRITAKQIESMKHAMNDVIDSSALDVSLSTNPAKKVASSMKGKNILLVASGHLIGNVHAMANQINETGKQFAIYAELPELNHHLLEGLTIPKGGFGKFTVLMVRSSLYDKRIQKRFDITADLFEKQGGMVVDYEAGGGSLLEESAEVLQFGAYVAAYLSMLNNVDPYDIHWVDELKTRMKK